MWWLLLMACVEFGDPKVRAAEIKQEREEAAREELLEVKQAEVAVEVPSDHQAKTSDEGVGAEGGKARAASKNEGRPEWAEEEPDEPDDGGWQPIRAPQGQRTGGGVVWEDAGNGNLANQSERKSEPGTPEMTKRRELFEDMPFNNDRR